MKQINQSTDHREGGGEVGAVKETIAVVLVGTIHLADDGK
jgi:hypothetical protein